MQAASGVNPVTWHAVGLALHLLNAALVFSIAWMLWRNKTSSAVASLAFGLNGTRPEVALWTAGNWELPACACVFGSIALALSQRARGSRARLILALPLTAVGILCKESAYAMPLIAFAIILARPNGRTARDFRVFLVGVCGVCAALFAWRWRLFQGRRLYR